MLTPVKKWLLAEVLIILISTDALVIKEMNIGEKDRLITLMTRDMGVIRAFAVGAKSIKSKKGAATGLLAYSNFSLQKKGDTYKVTEATPIKIFFGAGSDIVNLSLSQYFCELCLVFGANDTNGEEFLRLILNSLEFLTTNKISPSLIKAITEFRIAVMSGYMPNLVACDGCGKFEDGIMYFRLTDGTLLCENCKSGEYCIAVDRTVLDAMRHIIYSEFKNLYSFKIPENKADMLSRITEKYIIMQTEHKFKTLDFYNQFI